MSFQRKTWRDNPPSSSTPITAGELNRIEAGIAEVLKKASDLRDPYSFGSRTDLNEWFTPGRVAQNQSAISSDPDLNYPPGATHGFLDTIRVNSGYIVQIWVEVWRDIWFASRLYRNDKWSEWVRESREAPAPVQTNENENLIVQPRNAVVYGEFRPDMWSYPPRTQVYWQTPNELKVLPSNYKGDGYVGRLASATSYSQMQIKKVDSNDGVEVSCIDPVNDRHVTYKVEGLGVYDDFQVVTDIWTGAVTSGGPSKDTRVSQKSNKEWAFRSTVNGTHDWVPHHGRATAIDTGDVRGIFNAEGSEIDTSALNPGHVLTDISGFKLYQSVYGRHPESGSKNWIRVDQVTTISPDGLLQSESIMELLDDIRVSMNYAPMTPIVMGITDTMHILDGGSYSLATTPPNSSNMREVVEGRDAVSALFTSSSSDNFVAMSILDPQETYLLNHPSRETSTPVRVEERNSGLIKFYPSGFNQGSIIPKGTVWRMGAQWRYGEASNASQYV